MMSDNRVYFTMDTQQAIVEYNLSMDPVVREQLYLMRIQYPLNKLVENVINRFKFPYLQNIQSYDETKRQVVAYLVMHLSKYTADKGKAFSYFSVIAKNYLILHNNKAYVQQKRSVPLYDCDSSSVPLEEMLTVEAPDARRADDISEFVALIVTYWQTNVNTVFKKDMDRNIAMAVVELLKNADGIENFNKKALYIMIREITNCKSSYITKVVTKMRDITVTHYAEFLEYGTVGTNVK